MFEWLENSGVARLVQESLWGYPIVLSAHAVGMAIVAGIALMMCFRVIGLASDVPLSALKTMYRVALVGLFINVVSGTMLFVANADAFFSSTPFRIKIIMLVIGITLLIKMARRIFSGAGLESDFEPSRKLKIMAAVSIVAWIGVIVAGRLIAYIDWQDF